MEIEDEKSHLSVNSVDKIKFDEIQLKKTTIIARQIMLYFADFCRYYLPIFDKRNIYRIPFKMYDKFREQDKERFSRELYRLKRSGYIKRYFDDKEEIIELLPRGRKIIRQYITEQLEVVIPKVWDKKWRIVIYDISDSKKNEREVLRRKLVALGFLKLQESVLVYPFDCLKEVNLIKGMFFLNPHVQYIVADRIETEINLIKKFYDRGILTDSHLK